MAAEAPRIVFCDLDETFLSTDKRLIERNMAALDLLAERGIPFVPCTGRGLNGILLYERLAAHPAVRYAVTSSGAVVYDMQTREVLHAHVVGRERALQLYERVRNLNTTFDIFMDGRVLAERWRYERLYGYGIDAPMLSTVLSSRTPVDLIAEEIIASAHMVERIGIFCPMDEAGFEQRRRAREAVDAIDGLRWTCSHPVSTEIVDERASKGEALCWLCGYLGINVADSAAFGDSENDREMMGAAGLAVCMANGSDALKAAADMIAPANDEAGVAIVLEDLLARG